MSPNVYGDLVTVETICSWHGLQALDSRDSVAMALYSQCFSWIIMRINQKIKGKENFKSIGILDIFGFENFEVKTMCIQWPYEDNGEVTPQSARISHFVLVSCRWTGLNSLISTMLMRNSRSISISTSSPWSSWSTTGKWVENLILYIPPI